MCSEYKSFMSHVFCKILSHLVAWLDVLQIYSFVFFSAFGVICKKFFFPANGLKTFLTLCRSVTLLGSTLKSMIHFDSIFYMV